MNRLKKIGMYTLILMIVLCITLPIISTAAELTLEEIKSKGVNAIGNTVTFDSNTMHERHDLYCLNENKIWPNKACKFNVSSYVQIVGNKAINVQTGEECVNNLNGEIAYILSLQQGYSNGDTQSNPPHSNGQNALWSRWDSWISNVGSKIHATAGGNCSSHNDLGDEPRRVAEEMNTLSESGMLVEKTDINNLKTKGFSIDGENYVEVGPYNYQFDGTMSMELEDQNGKTISPSDYKIVQKYKEGNEVKRRYISASEVRSGSNFYIAVKLSTGAEKVNVKGKTTVTGTLYTAELWLLTTGEETQNMLLADPSERRISNDLRFNFQMDLTSDIEIEKVDSKYPTIKLANVGFIAQNTDTNKYVVKDGKGNISYTDSRKDATVFYTGKDGKLKIENVMSGRYYFYEVENKNPGYDPEPNKAIPCNVAGTANYKKITNTPKRGHIQIEKEDKDDTKYKLENVGFIVEKVGGGFITAGGDKIDDKPTYGGTRQNAKVFHTNKEGLLTVYEVDLNQTYRFYEVENPNPGYDPEPNKAIECTIKDTEIDIKRTKYQKIENELKRGHIQIEKEDEDVPEFKLPNVGFIVEKVGGGFITAGGDKIDDKPTYGGTRQNAKVFRTDEKGLLTVYEVDLGCTYNFYEVDNPNKGYEAEPEKAHPCTINRKDIDTIKRTTYQKIQNRRKYVDLSGFVWEDIASGKISLRNDIYQSSTADNEDKLVEDGLVTVRIKDKDGKTVQETGTKGGKYLFVDLEIDKLPEYYIEFEYDGLIFENVSPWKDVLTNSELKNSIIETAKEDGVNSAEEWDKWFENKVNDNGSKAAEGTARDDLNSKFVRVEGYDQDTVQVKDSQGKAVAQVDYELNRSQQNAKVVKTRGTTITANTKNTGLQITYDRKSLLTEIKGYNLGVYRRTQADVAISQDVQEVTVGIKGVYHVYKHGSKLDDNGEFTDDAWNVGVKYKKYQQPIYRADVVYRNPNDTSKELKVYLTYKIGLKNQASGITSSILDLVEYYDSRYEIEGIGTELDENGNIKSGTELSKTENEKNGDYKRVNVSFGNNGLQLESLQTKYFYIKFALSVENIELALNGKEGLESTAELTGYRTYKDGKLYAAVDKDAVLDNVTLGDKNTYEDDTNEAPTVELVVSEPRTINGFVFEDKEIELLLKNQQIREGNGKFDQNEPLISEIKAQLLEIAEDGTEVIAKNEKGEELTSQTDNNGAYSFTGFTPGTYKVKFIWGDNKYSCIDYKATVVDENDYNEEQQNPYFYRNMTEEDKLKSRATDDLSIRATIDKQNNSHGTGENNGYNYSTEVTQKTMESSTAKMKFGVEFDSSEIKASDYIEGKLKFVVSGMNLGIIRRPIQQINIDKRVSNVKVSYANQENFINADIDENGNITGQHEHVVYLGSSANRRQAQIEIQLDNEILQNAGIEVTYEFTIKNESEKDYNSEEFQRFGCTLNGERYKYKDESKLITLTPTKVVDYLGQESAYKICEDNEHYGWELVTLENIGDLIDEAVKNSDAIKQTKIYQVNTTTAMKPGESQAIKMVVEKRFTSGEDVNLMNQVEIVEVDKPHGSGLVSENPPTAEDLEKVRTLKPGNYIPSGMSAVSELDDGMAETVLVIPSQGGDRNYVPYIAIALTALVALAGGAYYIKKKTK